MSCYCDFLEIVSMTSKKCMSHLTSLELAYNSTTMNLQLVDDFTTSGWVCD